MFSSFPSRFLAVIFGLAPAAGAGVASPVADNEPVLVHAHAHNDYLNHHPLTDALDNGFTSVEADVWLARPGGELVLCHEEKASDGKPPTCDNGTSGKGASSFEATYLRPLEERVAANDGWVNAGYHRPVQLLIEVKGACGPGGDGRWACHTGSDAGAAVVIYQELERELDRHPGLRLSTYDMGRTPRVVPGSIQVVLSGAVPKDSHGSTTYAFAPVRNVFYDYQAKDCSANPEAGRDYPAAAAASEVYPLASMKWTACVSQAVADVAAAKHAIGLKLRLWDTPDSPPRDQPDNLFARTVREAVWAAERDYPARDPWHQVDYLSTDHLTYLREFLQRNHDS